MKYSDRRQFLLSAAVLATASFTGTSFMWKPKKPLLAFSTLGCPDWTLQQIIDFAVQHGYNGIEIRGIQRQLDLTKCDAFSTPQSRKDTRTLMRDKGLHIVDLGSSCTLHFEAGPERVKNLDEGKRFIDLANEIDCPFIRVFPNVFPKEQSKAATMELISQGLLELAGYAENTNVTVLLESHGDLVKINDLENIMQTAAHTHAGMVWDIANMWTSTKEDPVQAYERLKPYIRHTHIKDARWVDGKLQYCLLGKGEVPIMDAVDLLLNGGYKGYYSFEWEKLWHPEIAEPETAFSDYITVMKTHFNL